MSLDVYLLGKKKKMMVKCYACGHEHEEKARARLYSANITHNLGRMAEKAGIYEALWRPYRLKREYEELLNSGQSISDSETEDIIIVYAKEIIPYLEKGLADLKARPTYYEQFNSPNGWGLYKHFVPFVEGYLNACKQYPDAIVEVSR